MATLYVRDVPEKLYKRLRARARRNGRSLNAEVLELIDEAVLRELTSDEITDRLAVLAAEIDLPSDAPRPEDIMRQERDRRERGLRRERDRPGGGGQLARRAGMDCTSRPRCQRPCAGPPVGGSGKCAPTLRPHRRDDANTRPRGPRLRLGASSRSQAATRIGRTCS